MDAPGTLLLHEADVEELIDMAAVLKAVEAATHDLGTGEAGNQPRRRVFPPDGVLNTMSATWPRGGVSGLKTYIAAQRRVWFLVVLFDLTNRPIGLLEADVLGQFRTGAATGVAARALSSAGPKTVALIGTGTQARTQVLALKQALEISELRVFSRTQEKRERFAADVGAVAVASAEAAVRDADVVVTMTTSATPVLETEWVKPGALVIAVGSNVANRAELPADFVHAVDAVVVDQTDTAELESGDLILASYDFGKVVGLGEVLAGKADVRAGDRTVLFESHGLALWDVAAASVVVGAARATGVGQTVPLFSRDRSPDDLDPSRLGTQGSATERERERGLAGTGKA